MMSTQQEQTLKELIERDIFDQVRQRSRQKQSIKAKKSFGRPLKKVKHVIEPQYENFSVQKFQESIYQTIDKFLDFYDIVQVNKGFIFSEGQRKKFKQREQKKACSKQIELQVQHKWNQDEQKKKLSQIQQQINWGQELHEELQRYLIEVSSHIASQFTHQYYRIMLKIIYLIRLERKRFNMNRRNYILESELQILAKDISSNEERYYLFSLKFFKDRIPSYNKKSSNQLSVYENLVRSLANIIQKLMTHLSII